MGIENYEKTTPNGNVWDMEEHYVNNIKHYDISSHNIVELIQGVYDSTIGRFFDVLKNNRQNNLSSVPGIDLRKVEPQVKSPLQIGGKHKRKHTRKRKNKKSKRIRHKHKSVRFARGY